MHNVLGVIIMFLVYKLVGMFGIPGYQGRLLGIATLFETFNSFDLHKAIVLAITRDYYRE
jgi:hypothetical protein